MTNETKTIEGEVVPQDKLVKFASQTGLESAKATSLAETFRPIFEKGRAAIEQAKGVAESVKDATCVREIKKSRACRLALRAVRLESDEARKREKQSALLYGKAVDGFHNILLADLSPVETALQEAEDIAARAQAARLSALKVSREAELKALDCVCFGDVSAMSDSDYATYLADEKLLRQAKIDAAAKVEAERIKAAADAKAKAEAERIERERIAAENARLKAEADAREAAAKSERAEAARKLVAEQAAARAEREAAAKKLAEERAAAESAAKAQREAELAEERAAAKAAADAAAEKARKEQARLKAVADEERRKLAQAEAEAKRLVAEQAAARAEREAAAKKLAEERAAAESAAKAQREAELAEERAAAKAAADAAAEKARKEQARLKAVADEERRKLAQAEAEAKRLRDGEAERQAAEAAAKKKAEAAPDNAKAQAYADALRSLPRPVFHNSHHFSLLSAKVEALAKWIESQISTGELL